MTGKTRACRLLALGGYFALLALLLNQYTWIAPPVRVPVSVALALTAVPLLLPLRGLLHGRPYTHAWASLLALPYFVLGIDTIAAASSPPALGWGVAAASLALFAGAVGYARLQARAPRATGSERE